MGTHKDLKVWRLSIDLVKNIYSQTQSFPKEETYGICSQMRKAAVSIPSNIAEGYGRFSDKELIHFLFISLGSASELETQLIISLELNFLTKENFEVLNDMNNQIIRMLSSLIKSTKEKFNNKTM